jgi:hypothetical protein
MIIDITWIADAFGADYSHASLYAADLWGWTPEDCLPQLVIDILDMVRAVDAFKQLPYPCTVEPCP